MPAKAKKINLPWIKKTDYNKMQGQGRRIVNKFYHTVSWRKCRNSYILKHPVCEECERNGRSKLARVVDHIKPINPANAWDTVNGKYGDPLSFENLQSLCEKCHNRKSAKERWGK